MEPGSLAQILPLVLQQVTHAFAAWVLWRVGSAWVAAWDRSRNANARMDALEAKVQSDMHALINAGLGGIVEDLKAADDRLRRLEPKETPLPAFKSLHRGQPRPRQ